MSRYVLFIYVDGYDLDDVAAAMESEISAFIEKRRWTYPRVWLVSQRELAAPRSGDFARWDLGVNVELPDEKSEVTHGFSDIEALAEFFRILSERVGRDFIVGVSDTQSSDQWEFAFIDSSPVNFERIRHGMGVS